MKIAYNVKGDTRKQLVKALEEILGVKAEYMGVPTFSYHIGNFRVDKTGTLMAEDVTTKGFRDVNRALSQKGFEADDNGGNVAESNDGGPQNTEVNLLEIQMPTGMFTPRAIENLKKIVHAKGDLIKRAIGTEDLSIKLETETIGFPWFPFTGEANEVEHHERFIEALCNMAINQKSVTAKPERSENEKYDFRCFLLRLGFIGDEHKAFRRFYLRNLTGNSAFKHVE